MEKRIAVRNKETDESLSTRTDATTHGSWERASGPVKKHGYAFTADECEMLANHWFDAVVTDISTDGTNVRLMYPSVEGKLTSGQEGVFVGQHLRVQVMSTGAKRGSIDFKNVV